MVQDGTRPGGAVLVSCKNSDTPQAVPGPELNSLIAQSCLLFATPWAVAARLTVRFLQSKNSQVGLHSRLSEFLFPCRFFAVRATKIFISVS